MFRAGMKVECINAKEANLLREGAIYVVLLASGQFTGSCQYITIENGGGMNNGGWLASRFRPVVERKTDISIFTKMLTPSKRRVRERA